MGKCIEMHSEILCSLCALVAMDVELQSLLSIQLLWEVVITASRRTSFCVWLWSSLVRFFPVRWHHPAPITGSIPTFQSNRSDLFKQQTREMSLPSQNVNRSWLKWPTVDSWDRESWRHEPTERAVELIGVCVYNASNMAAVTLRFTGPLGPMHAFS